MLYLNGVSLLDGAGGIPTHTRGLVGGLAAADVAHGVAVPRPVPVDSAIVWRPGLSRRAWLELTVPAQIRRRNVDVWIEPAFNTPYAPRTTATVTWMPDATPYTPWAGRHARALRYVIERSCRRATRLLFTSAAVLSEYVALGLIKPNDSRLRIVPLGVTVGGLSAADVRASAPSFQRRPLWLGSGLPRKDLDTMQRASAAAGVEVDFIGPGMPGEAASHSELLRRMASAEVVIITSRYEGFSLPVAEARALGVPLLLSDIPIHREVSDGGTSFFFPPGDAAALAQMLRSAPWQAAGCSITWGRGWDKVTADLLEICEEI